MTWDSERYERNIRFFGQDGQDRLSAAHVAVVGVGGLGTHVVQQLALLGVGRLTLIDGEELDRTNFNRYVGVRHDDVVPGTLKVAVGERLARDINPETHITTIPQHLATRPALDATIGADYVFGCVDNEGARVILTELASAYAKPYFDLASEILAEDPLRYGGRVCTAWNGRGCLVCFNELDIASAQQDLMRELEHRDREAIYGVDREALGSAGPSVVSINGVVASLAVTEFMLVVSGVRSEPRRLLKYRGHMGGVSVCTDDPAADCYYCSGIRGTREVSNIYRYIRPNQG